MNKIVKWSKNKGYECSSVGDKQFSAFYAIMPDGRSIEQHYQCDVKGYDPGGVRWKLGKGKPPVTPQSSSELYEKYKQLWRTHLQLFPFKLKELYQKLPSFDYILRDSFLTTEINQARAIADLINEKDILNQRYGYHNDDVFIPAFIFVFGSNLKGSHDKGVALVAKQCYQADYDVFQGPTGSSYVIPTKNTSYETLSLKIIETYIQEFYHYVKTHPHLTFLVTRIGCGLAGFKDFEIAPLFRDFPDNCIFSIHWKEYLE